MSFKPDDVYDEIYDLQQYIVGQVGVNAIIGDPDVDDSQYPLIKIVFEDDGIAETMLNVETTLNLPLALKIVVQKGDEIKAFKTLGGLVRKINQFHDHKGHKLDGSISPEYDEETKTYTISVLYNLKLIIHDKE